MLSFILKKMRKLYFTALNYTLNYTSPYTIRMHILHHKLWHLLHFAP